MTIAEYSSDTDVAPVVEDDAAPNADFFSLTTLVRQWLRTSEAVERQGRPEGDDSPLPPKWTPPKEDPLVSGGLALVEKISPMVTPVAPINPFGVDPVDPAAPMSDETEESEVTPAMPLPDLPRRRRQPVAQPTRRLAVLIDAETTSADSADALFEALADQGTLSVCRAYGDWSSAKTRAWWPAPLRQHGIQPYHHFGGENAQRSLVALTIDAVDLAREAAVHVLVIVGDLVSLHPLVERLNASGLQIIGFGTTPTPRDVRDLCHEFVDLSGDPDTDPDNLGKHRA